MRDRLACPEVLEMWHLERAKIAFTGLTTTPGRLTFLEERAIAGDLRPLIDRSYALEDIAEAHRYVDGERKKGSVVIAL